STTPFKKILTHPLHDINMILIFIGKHLRFLNFGSQWRCSFRFEIELVNLCKNLDVFASV
ncbi:MAG: hypothetical protein AAF202_11655, partial [Pseudomonadota bacterium]